MIDYVVIKESGPTPRLAKRKQATVTRETLAETAANHHRLMMAGGRHKHFTIAGAREYGYSPRKGEGLSGKAFWKSYTGRKKKEKGHTRPLVWSGASEILAMIRDVRATRNRARLVQHARGLNLRNPKSSINMAEEIRTMSDAEVRAALAFAGEALRRKYQAIQDSRTTRI